jgi:hypothetical protein
VSAAPHIEFQSDPATALAFPERRRFVRVAIDELSSRVDIVLPDNAEVRLVNISRSGLLIETPARLCPGHALALLVRSEHLREKMRARVLRSTVQRLQPTSMFRVALHLAQPLELLDALTSRR